MVKDEDYVEDIVNTQLNVSSMDDVVLPTPPADGTNGTTNGDTSTDIQVQENIGANVVESGIAQSAPPTITEEVDPDTTGFEPIPYHIDEDNGFTPDI